MLPNENLHVNYFQYLTAFFKRCDADYRISPTHVNVYLALFRQWSTRGFENPIQITRRQTMMMGKIGARSTYHKAIRTLHDCGYIHYHPPQNKFAAGIVEMTLFE